MSDAGTKSKQVEFRKGLEGVVASETNVSHIDGQKCELIYRGYAIDELIGSSNYEEVSYLLLRGNLPTMDELADWKDLIDGSRDLDPGVLKILSMIPKESDPMAVLRTGISLVGHFDTEAEDTSLDAIRRKSVRVVGKMPTLVAAIARLQEGKEPIPPMPGLSHAANFLYMLHDREPSVSEAKALDAYLILLAEHGFNASTFASRVVTGTRSDYFSAIAAAVGTLKGPLHGAAARWAMEMLLMISSPAEVTDFVEKTIREKQRFMGFGHRVYRGEDPRAKHLKHYAKRLSDAAQDNNLLDICERLQKSVLEAKALYVNVDFYSAPLLHHLGIPTNLFTALFAMSRIAGWSAHVIEQTMDNRLIRPLAHYTGPRNLTYVPINQRESITDTETA